MSAYEVGEVDKPTSVFNNRMTNSNNSRQQLKRVLIANSNSSQAAHNVKCPLCSASHRLYYCEQFSRLTVPERSTVVFNAKLCFNCLSSGHSSTQCKYGSCRKCGKKHNTRLLDDRRGAIEVPAEPTPSTSTVCAQTGPVNLMQVSTTSLLATAIIYIPDRTGTLQPCRAILDSGS